MFFPRQSLGPDCLHGGTERGSAWIVDQAAKLALAQGQMPVESGGACEKFGEILVKLIDYSRKFPSIVLDLEYHILCCPLLNVFLPKCFISFEHFPMVFSLDTLCQSHYGSSATPK